MSRLSRFTEKKRRLRTLARPAARALQSAARAPIVNSVRSTLILVFAMLAASPLPASAQQTVNLTLGRFFMPRVDRPETDILLIEHHGLAFDISEFGNWTVGGEWLIPLGDMLEAGAGIAFGQRTVATRHVLVMNRDGSSIPRELGLRQVPIGLTVRVLPLRQSYRVQPYAGAGLAWIRWRFSESGDFATPNGTIFRDEEYAATGSAIGPLLVFGMRIAGDRMALGLESRYQHARGSFGPEFARVINPDIDLDGWTLQVTAGFRFLR